MSTDRGRALLDSLGQVTQQTRDTLAASSRADTSGARLLGLRFAAGARVVDVVTGRRGVVVHGRRSGELEAELFFVRYAEGGLVARGSAELELDPEPAAPAGK